MQNYVLNESFALGRLAAAGRLRRRHRAARALRPLGPRERPQLLLRLPRRAGAGHGGGAGVPQQPQRPRRSSRCATTSGRRVVRRQPGAHPAGRLRRLRRHGRPRRARCSPTCSTTSIRGSYDVAVEHLRLPRRVRRGPDVASGRPSSASCCSRRRCSSGRSCGRCSGRDVLGGRPAAAHRPAADPATCTRRPAAWRATCSSSATSTCAGSPTKHGIHVPSLVADRLVEAGEADVAELPARAEASTEEAAEHGLEAGLSTSTRTAGRLPGVQRAR